MAASSASEDPMTTAPQLQLYRLVRRGLLHEVQEMFAEHAAVLDVNAFDVAGFTCMHYAAQEGFGELVKYLHSLGATQQPTLSGNGDYPLHLAAWKNRTKAVTALLEIGASPNVTTNDGKFAISYAADDSEVHGLLSQALAAYNTIGADEMSDSAPEDDADDDCPSDGPEGTA
eukprot:a841407_182.p1 GENE.a841407_182~~a841407_182.p1  ORF type:complete len:188 (-),score=53.66 a841407_182:3-521(-)